jgi:integrase
MSDRRDSERFQLGEFWLSQRKHSPVWCITWFDQATRQTQRTSTGERDFGRAKIALAEHVIAFQTLDNEKPADVEIATILAQYWAQYANTLKSRETAKAAIDKWSRFWQRDTLADLTLERQSEFKAWFESFTYTRGKDPTPRLLSKGTIARQWNVGPTAFEWARKNHKIQAYPFVPYLTSNTRRERTLSIEEAAKLFDAAYAERGSSGEQMWRWLLLSVGTAARPNAPCEITAAMVSLTDNFIRLLPLGVEEDTRKRRPTLPICRTLRPWLEAWTRPQALQYTSKGKGTIEVPTLISWRGKQIADIGEGFERIKKAAGLTDPKIVPYTVRHTMITWLIKNRVPEWDREVWVGHKEPGSATTAGYVHLDPDYLKPAAEATDDFFDKVGRIATIHLRVGCVSAYSQDIPREGGKSLFSAVSMVRATGIEPVTPTMSRKGDAKENNNLTGAEYAYHTTKDQGLKP